MTYLSIVTFILNSFPLLAGEAECKCFLRVFLPKNVLILSDCKKPSTDRVWMVDMKRHGPFLSRSTK
jgi:hypothetical protein